MHYYIDGYNLLFRALGQEDALQTRRKRFLEALQEKISLLGLSVTVIFDSYYQDEEETRSGYGELEIIFTSTGETADACILKHVTANPRKAIVITSDKHLARQAQYIGAKTESAEEFIAWLNKRFQNRLKRVKMKPKVREPAKKVKEPEKLKKKAKPGPKATLAECFDYYLEIFLKRLDE